jgi:hypothetical protein
LGHSLEFEQIKNYVPGDDYRNINWKASARQGSLMTNSYTDEKSQQVYCVIDKSRAMKMPFEGLSLAGLRHQRQPGAQQRGPVKRGQGRADHRCRKELAR